jgi:hypothetical protein
MDSCLRRNDSGGINSIRWPDFSTALRSARNDTGVDCRFRGNDNGRFIICCGQISPLRNALHCFGRNDKSWDCRVASLLEMTFSYGFGAFAGMTALDCDGVLQACNIGELFVVCCTPCPPNRLYAKKKGCEFSPTALFYHMSRR